MPIHKRFPKRIQTHVKDIMNSPAVTASTQTTIGELAKLMWDKKVGSIVIVDSKGKIAGLITERDILYSVSKGLLLEKGEKWVAEMIMTKNVVSVNPDDTALTAVEKMKSFNIRHVVVTNRSGEPEGVLSLRDVLDTGFEFLGILQPPD